MLPVIATPHRLLGSTPSDAHTVSGDVLLAPDRAGAAFKHLLAELRRECRTILVSISKPRGKTLLCGLPLKVGSLVMSSAAVCALSTRSST